MSRRRIRKRRHLTSEWRRWMGWRFEYNRIWINGVEFTGVVDFAYREARAS